ncbi:MAG: Ig-like domain-containing protein [Atribacterota bacterium]|jgi:uncharacterized repeat protein (TIGR02543 family)|nr:Ig-like domain-containing protein [Atribacterota bacterium]MDD4289572.1 Ig-like domain-containing protein [Atribacterota bacterium]
MQQNKNKTFLFIFGLLLMLSLVFTFSGCVPPVPEVIDVTGVEIVEEDQSMKVDETLQLTAIVTPEDATNKVITWESDNPDVAAVDENGLVTALKSGTANITVTTEDGGFTDTIKITVTKPTPAPSPTPTPTPDKYTLTTTVLPADSGTVTGDGEYEQGDEVSITATNADGYVFVNWTAPAGSFTDETSPITTFTMPAEDVTITANFEEIPTYSVTIADVVGGTATVAANPNSDVLQGVTVTVTISDIEEGKAFSSIEVTGDDTSGSIITSEILPGEQYTFIMPDEDVTVNVNLISVYEVNFQTVDGTPAGVSSRKIDAINLSGFKIEIFTDAERNTKKTETETENDGTASVKLPNGEYWFRVSKEGYADYPPENNDLSVQRTPNPGYFVVDGADIIDPPIQVPIKRVYKVIIVDVGGAATVTATPNTEIFEGENVTITISGITDNKVFSSIEVTGIDTNNTITRTVVTKGKEYTFTMPAEDIRVTANFIEALFAEDFTDTSLGESSDNWSSDNHWRIQNTTTAGGNTPEMFFEGYPDDHDAYKLISPSFNSNEFSQIILRFQYNTFYPMYPGTYTLKVAYTTDEGATWEEIWSTPSVFGLKTIEETIDLDSNNSEIRIAWVFEGNPSEISYWSIDNILVSWE